MEAGLFLCKSHLWQVEEKRRWDKRRGMRKNHFFFPAACIATLHHPLLTVFPLLLKSAYWTQSYGCPISLSILGVPIVYFVLTGEISVCLLAFLNVGSTQPQLWDTDLPQPYPPSRHGAGGRGQAVCSGQWLRQVAGLPACARRGLQFLGVQTLLVILKLPLMIILTYFTGINMLKVGIRARGKVMAIPLSLCPSPWLLLV